jgi:uncharacterized protein CbrC (UPF0167 family)
LSDELPTFRYHPNPLKTGRITKSDTVCASCNQARGYVYWGHPHGVEEYIDCICPWCIADGSAHEKLDLHFTSTYSVGAGGKWQSVSNEIIAEVCFRTPGFSGWQQELWYTHCHDAAAFLGAVGYDELIAAGSDAMEAIRDDTGIDDDDEWDEFLEVLDKDGSPTAYLFQCLHCGQFGGYTDCD